MKHLLTILMTIIFSSVLKIYSQFIEPSRIIKSTKEFKIMYSDSLKRNDTSLTKESIYDTLGQLTEERSFENNNIISCSYKREDGNWSAYGIYSVPVSCGSETITKKTKDYKIIEEEYWGKDCPSGKTIYYKRIYFYNEKTEELISIFNYDLNGEMTESFFYLYEYY